VPTKPARQQTMCSRAPLRCREEVSRLRIEASAYAAPLDPLAHGPDRVVISALVGSGSSAYDIRGAGPLTEGDAA